MVRSPFGWSILITRPYEDWRPLNATVPDAAAWTGVPLGALMSTPRCKWKNPRGPKRDVIFPCTGHLRPCCSWRSVAGAGSALRGDGATSTRPRRKTVSAYGTCESNLIDHGWNQSPCQDRRDHALEPHRLILRFGWCPAMSRGQCSGTDTRPEGTG